MTTLWRSSGGKSDRAAAAGEVAKAVEATAAEAPAPFGDGAGVAAQFGGDLVIGGLVGLGAAEDEAGAEGEGLSRGVSVGQAAEVDKLVGGQDDAWGFTGHGARSLCAGTAVGTDAPQGSGRAERVQAHQRTRTFMLTWLNWETQH